MKILEKLRARLRGGDAAQVLRGTTTLALGTVLARLIGLMSMPILTRLYAPADFGVLAIFSAFVAVLAPILGLRYVVTIPLMRSDRLAINVLAASFVLIAVNALLLLAGHMLLGEALYQWMNVPALVEWGWLIAVGAAFVATYELGTYWATRTQSYSVIARTKVAQSIAGELTKLGFALVGVKPLGLLAGNVVEQGGGISSFFVAFRGDWSQLKGAISIKRVGVLARYYSSFPLYRLPSQFLLAFSMQVPVMLAGSLYGADAAGQFGLALMALAIPGNLIGQAVGQAFYGEVARLGKRPGPRLRQISVALQKRLFFAGVPASLFIMLLGERVFTMIFGEEWEAAGRYASMLAPFILLQLTSGPLVQVLNLLKSQLPFLLINIFRAVGLICIYLVCSQSALGPDVFAMILGGFLTLFYAAISIYIARVISVMSRSGHQ